MPFLDYLRQFYANSTPFYAILRHEHCSNNNTLLNYTKWGTSKKNLEETDPNIRRQRQDELRDVANNVEKSRELLLQTSMISGLERSEAIT
jgi:hypothetical protein